MWAIGSAPLIVAVDVANMTKGQAETLLNPEVTAMHQDPLASVGKRVATDPSCVQHIPPEKPAPGATNPVGIYPPCQIWAKALSPATAATGSTGAAAASAPVRAVALYNSDDTEHTIHLDLWGVFGAEAAHLSESTKVRLRDLWARQDLGMTGISELHNVTVPASGVVLLRVAVAA
jgi:hypothetical protein